jgi:hypothetical protein
MQSDKLDRACRKAKLLSKGFGTGRVFLVLEDSTILRFTDHLINQKGAEPHKAYHNGEEAELLTKEELDARFEAGSPNQES